MTINIEKNNEQMIVNVEGRVDTTTAPEFEKEIDSNIDGIKELILNLEKLEYISSAGLRVLLKEQKEMNKKGKMILKNVNDTVMEVLAITGFANIMHIE